MLDRAEPTIVSRRKQQSQCIISLLFSVPFFFCLSTRVDSSTLWWRMRWRKRWRKRESLSIGCWQSSLKVSASVCQSTIFGWQLAIQLPCTARIQFHSTFIPQINSNFDCYWFLIPIQKWRNVWYRLRTVTGEPLEHDLRCSDYYYDGHSLRSLRCQRQWLRSWLRNSDAVTSSDTLQCTATIWPRVGGKSY